MFDLSPHRPDQPSHDPRKWLVINVRSQGEWASIYGNFRFADCLRRPGVLDFTGPADDWARHLPWRSQGEHIYLVPLSATPCLAPGSLGAMVIDYDARRAWSLQRAAPAFFVRSVKHDSYYSARMDEAVEQDWVCELVASGHIRTAVSPTGQSVDLPPPPAPADITWSWLKATAHDLLGVSRNGHVDFPLHAPGWDLREALPSSTHGHELFAAIAPCLNTTELAAWEAWARRDNLMHRPIPAIARLASSAARLAALNAGLPQAARVVSPASPRL